MDIKDKISKLLALAESPNENEARLALQKAQALMAQHALSMQDFTHPAQVLHQETDITFSKRRASWTLSLASVIAENYCCRAFARRHGREQTRHVCLAGFQDDLAVCEKVLRYALACINRWTQNTVRLNKALYTTREMGNLTDSYAKGFIAGVYTTAHRCAARQAEQTALVTAVPSQVDKSVSALKTEKLMNSETIVRSVYNVGFGDGMRFRVADKLTDGARQRQPRQDT